MRDGRKTPGLDAIRTLQTFWYQNRAVASERNQHCRGKVSSKPEGLSRGWLLGEGL